MATQDDKNEIRKRRRRKLIGFLIMPLVVLAAIAMYLATSG